MLPRLAAAAPAPAAPAPRHPPAPEVPGFAPAAPRAPGGVPGFAPARPFDDGSGLLVGPGHPGFGRGDPLMADRFRPRFDPLGPGGPSIPGPFGGAPDMGRRGGRPRLPGEPDPDHLNVPGLPPDGFL